MKEQIRKLIDEGLSENGYLSEDLMDINIHTTPIFCVDAILVPEGNFPSAILVYRNESNFALPEYLWVVGGKVSKGRKMVDVLEDKIKKETGLELKVNPDDQLFTEDGIMIRKKGKFHTCGNMVPEGTPQRDIYHTPQTIYLVRTPPLDEIKDKITPRNGNSKFKIVNQIETGLDLYIKKAIRCAWEKIGYEF